MCASTVVTILVVDDETIVRETCQSMLESLGFTAVSAGNGREGVDVLERVGAAISAVVLDLTMPVMSGEEAFVAMRALRPGLPILITSGYCSVEVIDRLTRQPACKFLRKPYSMTDLQRALGGLLSS